MTEQPDVDVAPIGRRSLLVGAGGLFIGGVAGALLAQQRRARPPVDADGLPIALLAVGDARRVADRIAADGPVLVPPGGARLAIVRWDPGHEAGEHGATDRYGPNGENHPMLDGTTGLIALSLISTHLCCRVVYCESSRWFEDPCHGSRWNTWGEWAEGPAPRGLDRFGSDVRDDGVLVVDLTRHISGPRRGWGVLEQPAAGPSCVDP